jgi:choline/glycine/proline betaine transport protein
MVSPTTAAETIGTLVGWTSEWFGWFYILFATAVLVFVLFLGISRYGRTKLGPEHSTPQYSTFAWASMLFAAGIGTDLMFLAVADRRRGRRPSGRCSTTASPGGACTR